jgi:hypothetical protein
MFTWIRSRLRFAGRIGWVDGRRGYPAEEHCVELVLHSTVTPGLPARQALAEADAPPASPIVHPLTSAQRP